MSLTSPILRREQRKYARELLARTLMAPCPRRGCHAKPNAPCIGPRRRPIAGAHWSRSNEAKRLGFVSGRWFSEKKHGVYV